MVDGITLLHSDGGGFIKKLPHRLVESFKSTLDEAREADILLHVVDVSHPDFENQIKTVNETLKEMGAHDKDQMLVFNKIDQIGPDFLGEDQELPMSMEDRVIALENSFLARDFGEAIFISAKKKVNIDAFRGKILEKVKEAYKRVYPHHPISVEYGNE